MLTLSWGLSESSTAIAAPLAISNREAHVSPSFKTIEPETSITITTSFAKGVAVFTYQGLKTKENKDKNW